MIDFIPIEAERHLVIQVRGFPDINGVPRSSCAFAVQARNEHSSGRVMNDRAASRAVSQSATPKNMRSKPRFLPLIPMEKAGQAAGYSSSRESGIKKGLGYSLGFGPFFNAQSGHSIILGGHPFVVSIS